MQYIYNGLNSHPCNGFKCTIGWKFETSDSYMIYFIDKDPRNIGFEIADMSQLKKL